jgi:CMP-N,N'-diacetyllegionaminic acid synthase
MTLQLDIVALIPARSGSKGIKDKNILPLDGHPLIAYSIVAAKQSKLIREVFVTTDSKYYSRVSMNYGATVPFLRPAEISGDMSTDKDFFLHFIKWCIEVRKKVPDMVIHLRPSSPLRDFRIIDGAIQKFIDNPKASALRSCQDTELTPYKMFFEKDGYMKPFMTDNKYKESYNQPRQVFTKAYLPNGYIDIIRPSVLLDTDLLHGDKTLLNITPEIADIDNISDYESAKLLLNRKEYSSLKLQINKYQL